MNMSRQIGGALGPGRRGLHPPIPESQAGRYSFAISAAINVLGGLCWTWIDPVTSSSQPSRTIRPSRPSGPYCPVLRLAPFEGATRENSPIINPKLTRRGFLGTVLAAAALPRHPAGRRAPTGRQSRSSTPISTSSTAPRPQGARPSTGGAQIPRRGAAAGHVRAVRPASGSVGAWIRRSDGQSYSGWRQSAAETIYLG